MPEFARSVAAVIGVDAYRHGVAPLTTAVRDARAIAACLTRDHGYEVRLLLDGQASLAGLTNLLQETLQKWVGADDRLLVYFAGHGIALDGEGGPEGFLVPADARPDDRGSLLPMVAVNAALEALPCRHGLLVLDCCFAGSFRWATTRSFVPVTRTMTRKRYERFLESPAWQVLTSAAHDQTALDALGGLRVNHREAQGAALAAGHSPFAASLLAGLQGAADVAGDGGRPDGVITATELYLYLRDQVEAAAADQLASQTPGLWPLRRHGRGEFLFHVAGRALSLEPDPPLDEAANPWLGLRAYAPEDDALFFGRERVLASLRERVLAGTGEEEAPAEDVEPLIAVLGVSGAGKSSVVNAGLVPWLRRARGDAWVVIGPRRPGGAPMAALDAIERELEAAPAGAWRLVVIDQFEEIYSLCRDAGARAGFFARINTWLSSQAKLRVLLTARADYEPQLSGCALAPRLARGRFVIPPMTSDELRAVIEGPASARVLYFEPPELVDEIVDAVVATPGGLPLLSFTLSELYRRYLARGADDRALRAEDYHALGGVVGALRSRAVALHAEATPAEQRTIKNVTLRMLSIEGGQLARRRVSGRELAFADPEEDARVKALLERFTAARLFVRSRGERLVGDGGDGSAEVFVEPAHDTLVLAWDRVHAWLDESGERLAYQRSLWAAARLWDEGGRRRAYLWDSDPRLAVVVAGERAEPAANAIEAAFLAASARKRRRARVRLIVTVVVIFAALALLAVVAVIAAVRANEATEIAKNEADRASAQERKAELEAVIARRRLAASSYDHAQLHDERGDVTRALGRVGAALANVGDDRAGAVYVAKLLDLAARAPHTTARASALARPLLGASLIDPVTGLASRPPAGIDAKRWGGLFALALSHDRRLVAGERDGQIVVVAHGDPGGAPLLAVEQHPQVSGADELFASDMLYNPDYNSSVPEDMRSRLLLSASGETIVVVSVVGDTWAWPARGGARTWADGLWLRAPDSGLAVAASLAIDRRGRSLLWAFDANAGRARVLDVDRREAVIDATLDGVVASVTIAPAADRAYVVVGRPLRPGEQVCSAAARSYDGAVDYVRFERACQPPEGVEPSSTRRFVLHSFALDGGAQLRGLEVIEEHPFAVVDAAADGSRLLTRAQSAGDDAAHGVRVHAQTDRVDRFLRLDVAAASTARAVAFGADG
ncbi:MAG: caspase family protein, partial [Myxococcales bacterium]|nr:caspase family protein [Myxococcales bacterium]